jgi:murein DD-endopeptidase MepM/ murein hydrolase activator NlpD
MSPAQAQKEVSPTVIEPKSLPKITQEVTPKVIQKFGVRNPKVEKFSPGKINIGVDLEADVGTPLYTPKGEWRVEKTFSGATKKGYIGNRTNSGYGNSILIKNTATGEELRLSHLSKVGVRRGQLLKGGDRVAESGWTGNASMPHVDTEYYTSSGKLADATKTKYVREIFNKISG